MRNLFLLIPVVALFACNSKPAITDENIVDHIPDTAAKASRIKLGFDAPERIDTSDYVFYKLVLNSTGKETESEYGSSSRSYITNYWNIVFYNTITGQYHLLDESRKMLINVANGKNENETDVFIKDGHTKPDTLMYYSVTINDFNKDGKLDSEDPEYLFSSDKKGHHFKQISPDSLHVTSWKILHSTGKLLIRTIKDTNHDGKLNDDDEATPYIYDLKTGAAAKEVFTNDFKLLIKQTQQKLWKKSNSAPNPKS